MYNVNTTNLSSLSLTRYIQNIDYAIIQYHDITQPNDKLAMKIGKINFNSKKKIKYKIKEFITYGNLYFSALIQEQAELFWSNVVLCDCIMKKNAASEALQDLAHSLGFF